MVHLLGGASLVVAAGCAPLPSQTLEGTSWDDRAPPAQDSVWLAAGNSFPGPSQDGEPALFSTESLPSCSEGEARRATFLNRVQKTGINFSYEADGEDCDAFSSAFGGGLSVGDFDGDGWVDVFLVNQRGEHGYYRNRGSMQFDAIVDGGGIEVDGSAIGSSAADWDGDGDLDIAILGTVQDRFFENDGQGRFDEVTDEIGAVLDDRTVAIAWADFDADGELDFFACSFMGIAAEFLGTEGTESDGNGCENGFDDDGDGLLDCADDDCAMSPDCGVETTAQNRLYLNNGDGSFRDATDRMPEALQHSACFAATTLDINRDGILDIATVHDKGNLYVRDQVFIGQPDGTFTEESRERGLDQCCAGMGLAVGDLNGDGLDDIWKADTPSDHVMFNDGTGHFYDATVPAGVWPEAGWQPTTWDVDMWDFDEDGDLDVFVLASTYDDANMAGGTTVEDYVNHLWVNDGTGFFEDQLSGSGLDEGEAILTRSLARADFDRNGSQDILMVGTEGTLDMFLGPCTGMGRLVVEVKGTQSHPMAPGTEVVVHAGDLVMRRTVQIGGQVQSSQPGTLHFGLNGETSIDMVEVVFPSGAEVRIGDIAPNQRLVVTEPPL